MGRSLGRAGGDRSGADVDGVIALNPPLYWAPGDPVEALMSTTRQRPLPPHRRTPRTPEGQRRYPALDQRLPYDDPGADYFTRLHPEQAKKRAINQLRAMGYQVTLTHAS